jgi:hypothetical protein
MKLRYLLLFAMALIIPAGYANAGPIDPSVIINKCHSCDAISFTKNSVSNPIVLDLVNGVLPPITYEWEGKSPLTVLYVALADPLPYEVFTCASDIFKKCEFVSTVGTVLNSDDEFEFYDGSLAVGGTFTAQVAPAPEPSTMLMLFIDGLALIGLQIVYKWRKRESAKV